MTDNEKIKVYRIEPQIGEVFNLGYRLENYITKETDKNTPSCEACCFGNRLEDERVAPEIYCNLMNCNPRLRKDGKDVYFVKVKEND